MIDLVMTFLQKELNNYLGTLFPVSEPTTVLSSLVKADGSPAGIDNKIALSLLNVERETALGARQLAEPSADGIERVIPPLHLNLFILLSSNFSSYPEALRFLSTAIGYLHAKPVFTPRD